MADPEGGDQTAQCITSLAQGTYCLCPQGTRQAEELSLRWTKVDLGRRTITLLHTKNKRKRTIPINQTVCELLQVKRKVRSFSGYVFTSINGSMIDARNLSGRFTRQGTRLKLTTCGGMIYAIRLRPGWSRLESIFTWSRNCSVIRR